MTIEPQAIPDVKVLIPNRIGDERGFFAETYSRRLLISMGVDSDFVQDNHSLSRSAGVLRGLHYQLSPMAQGKLIRVIRGSILDVVVDIRRGSPTFGKHVAVEMSAENFKLIYVPAGFAHGFLTLRPDTEVLYKVSAYYSPAHDRGILWNDPDLGIDWGVGRERGVTGEGLVLSEKDRRHPRLCEATELF